MLLLIMEKLPLRIAMHSWLTGKNHIQNFSNGIHCQLLKTVAITSSTASAPLLPRSQGLLSLLTCHMKGNILTSLKSSLTNPEPQGKDSANITCEKENHLEEREMQWDIHKSKHELSETNLPRYLLQSIEAMKFLHEVIPSRSLRTVPGRTSFSPQTV